MDDIAKAAGYSKATLYVYFENKEEIVGVLVLDSMKKLYHYILLLVGFAWGIIYLKSVSDYKQAV